MNECPKCGKELKEGAIRCIHCGSFLEDNDGEEKKSYSSEELNVGISKIEEPDSRLKQREKYRQYGLGLIISGVGLWIIGFPLFWFILLGAGVITFVTNLDWNKKKSNAPEDPSKHQPVFSIWNLPVLTLIVVSLITIFEIWAAFQPPQNFLWLIISSVAGYWFGSYAAEHYAPKINGSQSWAFVIGFTFAFIGFICYWVYYKHKLSKEGPQTLTSIPSTDKAKILKTILTVIGAAVVIIFLLVIFSYIIFGSGLFTGQKSQEVVPGSTTSTTLASVYSTYENTSLGFKINLPEFWTYKINSNNQIQFDNPDKSSMIVVEIDDLSGTKYGASSIDDLTEFIIEDSSNQNLQLITNKASTLSGYYARELVYIMFNTGNDNAKFKVVRRLARSGNKFYDVSFWSYETNFDVASTVAPTVFNSFTIETPQYTSVQPQSTSNYLQGSESNNPYAVSGMYAQRILSCSHGDVQDWEYCAQQCRLANSQGVYCNEQSLKSDWDKNH